MKNLLAVLALCAFAAACSKGAPAPFCAAEQTNRCGCEGGGEGLQQCLPSGEAFGACTCAPACANGGDCVFTPSVLGQALDQAGPALEHAHLLLPDPVDVKGYVAVQQIADPPVQVLAQDPAPGALVRRGTRMVLTVTMPPDQETLGLPNSNFLVGKLKQDTDEGAEAYYEALDPGPFKKRATLKDWKDANGFGTPADSEASAIYVTHADLGFGRHMHMRRSGKRVAFYVDNYPTLDDAIAGTRYFATVAMEYSPGPNGAPTDPYFTQFYTYNKKGERIADPILDGHGAKNQPAVCLVCHGGNVTDPTYQANGGNVGAKFIPFDLDAEQFSDRPGYRREDQEAAFKAFNEAVLATWDPADPAYPAGDPAPVPEMIKAWYGGTGLPSATFKSTGTPIGWDVSPESYALYHQVFKQSCQTCHSQREATRNFSTYAKFVAAKPLIHQRVFEEGAMPLSEKGARNFWLSYPEQPKLLANWLGIPLKAPGKPVARIAAAHEGPFLTEGTTVTLDGTGSQFATNFAWRQVSGPAVALAQAAPDGSKVSFKAPAGPVTLAFELVASIEGRNSDPATLPVAVQGVPSQALSVVAVAGGNSASVSWTAPETDGNSAIQHSTVIANPGGAVAQAVGTGTQAIVTGLTAGVTYTFTVVVTNEIGDSAPSAASNAVTVFTNPGAPTNVVATRGDSLATVTWTAPANTGGVPLVQYLITGTPGPLTPVAVPASSTAKVLTGLTNGTSYVFTVVADNGSQGPGGQSNAVTPATLPAAPASASAAPGNGSATVSWTAPASDGGAAVSGYTVTTVLVSGSGAVPAPSSVGGASLAVVVNGLTNNATYSFTVKASNAVGTGPATGTNAVLPSATPGVPSAPQGVSAAFAGASQTATVSWSAPAVTGNSALTAYQITGSPGPASPVMVGPGVTTTNISGLTGGLNYTFTVVAVNTQGAGPGGTSGSALIQGPPQAPSLGSLTPGYVSGTVGTLAPAWSAPGNNGGSPITGYVITGIPSSVTVGNVTSATLSSATGALARCTVYSVGVAAQNTWGTGPVSNTIAARDAVAPSTMAVPGSSTAPAQINLSWSAPGDGGCPITSYTYASSPAGQGATTTSTAANVSFTSSPCYNVSGGVSSQTCTTRSWSFRVQATNVAGTGALSGSTAALRPKVSFNTDNVPLIFSSNPIGTCASCHTSGSGNVLTLLGTTNVNIFNSIWALSPPVVRTATPSTSYLVLCPTNNAGCNPTFGGSTSHPGGLRFTASTNEYATLLQWITDGAQF